jgi:hypothetical protein
LVEGKEGSLDTRGYRNTETIKQIKEKDDLVRQAHYKSPRPVYPELVEGSMRKSGRIWIRKCDPVNPPLDFVASLNEVSLKNFQHEEME